MMTYIAPSVGANGGARPADNTDLWIRAAIRVPMAGIFLGLFLFGGAGTIRWERGWILLLLVLGTILGNLLTLLIKNPDLLRARWSKPKGTKSWDRVFGAFYALGNIAFFVMAGVDVVRYEWTTMPVALAWIGAGLHMIGTVPVVWSFMANPFLEPTVRIQTDRGHSVVTDGPYRYVRHPLYVGVILWFVGWGLVAGSWAATGVAGLLVLMFIIRTALEDRTLQEELDGYREYCEKTRYRLIPGVW